MGSLINTDLTPIDEHIWYDESDATFYFTNRITGSLQGPYDSFMECKEANEETE